MESAQNMQHKNQIDVPGTIMIIHLEDVIIILLMSVEERVNLECSNELDNQKIF